MLLYMVFSGPQSSRDRAIKAFKGAGLTIVLDGRGDPLRDTWGHPDGHETVWQGETTEDGHPLIGLGEHVAKKPRYPVAFLTIEGDDVNLAIETAPEKWVLRAHFDKPEAAPVLSVEEKLAALGLTPADLRSILA